MSAVTPSLILRLGTHAEKDYLEKTIKFFDGFMVAGNLIEATPGATATLLVKISGKKVGIPYFIDPMTYGYSLDLDFLKSESKPNSKKPPEFKRSYKKLAEEFGGVFVEAMKRDDALSPADFKSAKVVQATCKAVANYQIQRPAKELESDDEYADYAKLPSPAAILTPYFFIDDSDTDEWLDLAFALAKATADLKPKLPVHSVICADSTLLNDSDFVSRLADELPATGVDGVWLWFTNLDEHSAKVGQLRAFRELVNDLSEHMTVNNMHGGYFSLVLSEFGMSGTSHGVGYGEKKDIAPVLGQSTPMVRYYLPDVRKRLGVPDIERTFPKLKIKTVEDFFEQISGCVICRGVLKTSLRDFTSFGELHFAKEESKRQSQTPAAAKLCRFHFLLSRVKERDTIAETSHAKICKQMATAWEKWSAQPSIANDADHLERWIKALGDE